MRLNNKDLIALNTALLITQGKYFSNLTEKEKGKMREFIFDINVLQYRFEKELNKRGF